MAKRHGHTSQGPSYWGFISTESKEPVRISTCGVLWVLKVRGSMVAPAVFAYYNIFEFHLFYPGALNKDFGPGV